MTPAIPHCTPPARPADIPASRFASLIRRDTARGCRVGLIGLADDLGVRLNHGRPGAKDGPRAFRAALAKYGVADPYGWEWPAVLDAGDIVPASGSDESALRETHRRVTEAVAALLGLGLFPIGIGGGHDLTFPFVRAVNAGHVSAGGSPLAGVYFDAHLDVREAAGSGMPFRALVEQCGVSRLRIVGMDPFANSREHQDWYRAHGGVVVSNPAAADEPVIGAPAFLSVDLDAIDGAQAPGVSAMNPRGLDAALVAEKVRTLGADSRVRCFDIMELCPTHDESGRTARVAAHLFLSFLRGFAERRA
ncbi:MAG: formimidoylglutamase [Phycisphaerales bacterium]